MAATYETLVDWDGDGGLAGGDFETSLGTWQGGGTAPGTDVSRSTVRAYVGTASMLVGWRTGTSFPIAIWVAPAGVTYIIGKVYTFSAWVWVPTGSPDVVLLAQHTGNFSPASVGKDQWVKVALTFTATQTTRTFDLQIWPNAGVTDGMSVWVDNARIITKGEDVGRRLRADTPVSITRGRDQARALSPMAAGSAGFTLDNTSRDYSPENSASPLAGTLLPARSVTHVATYSGHAYPLFTGTLDDYSVSPWERTLDVTALDAMGKLQAATVTTGVYAGLRTGQAIGFILDAIGWPTDLRDLDVGGTTIRYWWEDGTVAYDAVQRLIQSEGPPSIAYVAGNGVFVFRDRHHRLVRATSTASQVTLRDKGIDSTAAVRWSWPLDYDQGWRDVINSAYFGVDVRTVSDLADVWSSDAIISMADGETKLVTVSASDPFINATPPVAGTDFVQLSGTVTATLTRTSGASTTIILKATGGPAQIAGLQLRAMAVSVGYSTVVGSDDTTSQQRYGKRSWTADAPWAGVHDAQAISEIIMALRAERLPAVTVRLTGGNDAILAQQLQREVSDRVTIVDTETGLNRAFYVERITHSVRPAGSTLHGTDFGCEAVPTVTANVFTFDDATLGKFDTGAFGGAGLSDPSKVFIFDHATQGKFDTGVFGL